MYIILEYLQAFGKTSPYKMNPKPVNFENSDWYHAEHIFDNTAI